MNSIRIAEQPLEKFRRQNTCHEHMEKCSCSFFVQPQLDKLISVGIFRIEQRIKNSKSNQDQYENL